MKPYPILIVALLSAQAQAHPCTNPVEDSVVRQDIHSLYSLGQQYRMTGKSVADAWHRESAAKQEGNLVAMAWATEQLALYRFQLSAIKTALSSAKTKLSADIEIAARAPCPADSIAD